MRKKHRSKNVYNRRYDFIAKFVTFKHDKRKNLNRTLSPKQKSQVTRYYNYLKNETRKPHVLYKSKSRANIRAALHSKGVKFDKLKVVPIETYAVKVKKVKIEKHTEKGKVKRTLKVSFKFFEQSFLDIDLKQLAKYGKKYLEKLLAKYPDNYRFIPLCGRYRYHLAMLRERFINTVTQWQGEYSNSSQWLRGFILVNDTKKQRKIYCKKCHKQFTPKHHLICPNCYFNNAHKIKYTTTIVNPAYKSKK